MHPSRCAFMFWDIQGLGQQCMQLFFELYLVFRSCMVSQLHMQDSTIVTRLEIRMSCFESVQCAVAFMLNM